MAIVDKNKAIIDYLLTCNSIVGSPLYFNFINAKNDNKQIIASANDKVLNRSYVDGSVMKQYECTIIVFKTLSTKPIVQIQQGTTTTTTTNSTPVEYPDENVADLSDVQKLIDWITEQDDARYFPNFGSSCLVEGISTTSENPNLDGIDASITPALAKYSITIQVDYLDSSKVIWNKEEG